MAFAVAEAILKKLGPLAAEQAGLLWSLESDFRKLKSTVSSIRAVLLDAEEQSGLNNQVQYWLDELKHVLYDADDLLDDFSTDALLKQQRDHGSRCLDEVCLFFTRSNQLVSGLTMAHRLKAIRTKLDEIDENRRKFELQTRRSEPAAAVKLDRRTDSFARIVLVGRDEDSKKIIDMLRSINDEQKIEVIPILGMGGLGKTALAQSIYNNESVSTCFQLKIWICVSDNFDQALVVRKMLESIIKRKAQDIDVDILKGELKKEIDNKRFLLVLDDVWNHGDYKGNWDNLMNFLCLVGAVGSKIIVTTRLEDVANYLATKEIKPHKLKGLSPKESWSMFEQIALCEVKGGELFAEIGKEVVIRCMGVPLAISVMAGALSSTSNEVDWKAVRDKQKMLAVGDSEKRVLATLRLSYDNLPSELRSCFVYCSLFPKDYEINVKMLVQLWMGQGFINTSQSSSASFEVGVEYFKSLLSRFFFQEPVYDEFGSVKGCKMHDLMHDLALEVAGEEMVGLEASNSMEGSVNIERIRHISFHFERKLKAWKAPEALAKATKLRTFIRTNLSSFHMKGGGECGMIVSNNTSLRVLSLDGAKLESMPRSIHKLTHLRYLNLSRNPMKVLPAEITVLVNLQALILDYCVKLKQLPRDVVKLTNLEFLSLLGSYSLEGFPLGIGRLTCLRELSLFIVSVASHSSQGAVAARINELKHLDNLHGYLEIKRLELVKDEGEAKAASLFRKQHLQVLKLAWRRQKGDNGGGEGVRVLEALEPHENLKQLILEGYGGSSVPSWFSSSYLKNLVSLRLFRCGKLSCLSLSGLLVSLEHLMLFCLGRLKYIESDGGQFLPRLKSLRILRCPNLVSWRSTTETTMPQFPCLSRLVIRNCRKLVWLPHFSVPYVKKVELKDVNCKLLDEFAASLPPPNSSSLFKKLRIVGIRGLQSLPQGLLPKLAFLTSLWIEVCPNLTNLSPPAIGGQDFTSLHLLCALPHLRYFHIVGLPGMKGLPKWLQHSSNLQVLLISRCDGLRCLPKWLPKLTRLRVLLLQDTHFLSAKLKSRKAGDWPKVAHIRDIVINNTLVQCDGNYLRVEEPAALNSRRSG